MGNNPEFASAYKDLNLPVGWVKKIWPATVDNTTSTPGNTNYYQRQPQDSAFVLVDATLDSLATFINPRKFPKGITCGHGVYAMINAK